MVKKKSIASYLSFGCASLMAILTCYFSGIQAKDLDPFFKKQEVRVIRQQFFSKKGKLEVGLNAGAVLSSAFITSYLMEVSFGFHLNKYVGFALNGAYGFSAHSDTFTVLEEQFSIFPEAKDSHTNGSFNVLATGMYGKALSTFGLIYFDTYMIIGGGFGELNVTKKIPEEVFSSYGVGMDIFPFWVPFINAGIGQRIFVSQLFSLKIEVRDSIFLYQSSQVLAEFQAETETTGGFNAFHSIQAFIGGSIFF